MNYWEQQEADLLKKENAWLDELSPFMRLIDSHVGFMAFWSLATSLGFLIGLVIGFLL